MLMYHLRINPPSLHIVFSVPQSVGDNTFLPSFFNYVDICTIFLELSETDAAMCDFSCVQNENIMNTFRTVCVF